MPLGTGWDVLWREPVLPVKLMEKGFGIPSVAVVFPLSVLMGIISSTIISYDSQALFGSLSMLG